jgi:restriction system protein
MRDGATAIDLIDGELLADKLKELGLGVKTKTVEAVEIDENWFSSFKVARGS